MALLVARDLVVSVAGRVLHRDLSLDLDRGELVGLVGPSGSGKTTLLRCLALLQDPTAGTITLDGRTASDIGYPMWRRQVALVAQRPTLLGASVRDNLARPFGFSTSSAPFPEPRAGAWLRELGLETAHLDQDATTLSEGQKQRVSLIRSLLLEPEVLLLDEPTAALDSRSASATEALLRQQVTERAAAALIVTHDRTQADRLCDRLVELPGA